MYRTSPSHPSFAILARQRRDCSGRSSPEAEDEEMGGVSRGGADHGAGEDRGLFWKLPVVRSKELGKLGPGMGLGAGCGVGFGLGLFGGAGLGVGFPGLQFGFGVGAGCGVGLGFGYGVGRGVAVDEHRRYSNVGHPMGALPSPDQLVSLADQLFENTKKLVEATSKTIEKWRS